MEREQLAQLERAAVDIMSPPHAVSDEVRKQSEALFMELRQSKLPYNMCKFILDHSSSDFVLFQAVSAIREAAMREWPLLPAAEREGLRSYLLSYLTTYTELTGYVKSQVMHMIALLVKRASLESDRETVFESMFSAITQLLTSDFTKMRLLGCSLLSALLTEFSNCSTLMNLPLDFHIQAKNIMQTEQLLKVLHLCVQVLRQYSDHTHSDELLPPFLQLTSQILSWDFRQRNFFKSTTLDHTYIPLRPPRSFAPTLLEQEFLTLFFRVLPAVRCSEEQLHHVIQCLTQLASLTRPVFATEAEEKKYVHHFVSGLLLYLSSSPDLSSQEVYGLSCVARRLAATFPAEHFGSLEPSQLALLVTALAQLTVLCAQHSAQEQVEEDSLVYQESLEHFLEVWVNLVSMAHLLLSQPLAEIFTAYLQSKLSAPRGWRVDRADSDEILDTQEDDRILYKDELSSIGCIARAVPGHALPLLLRLLTCCTSEVVQVMSAIQHSPHTLTSHQAHLHTLHEDLHWLILITGYTLSDVVEGESVLIPTELMEYSIFLTKDRSAPELEKGFDIAQLVGRVSEVGGQELELTNYDPIIALVVAVCQLCVVERVFVSQGLAEALSPQLCDSCVWCLGRLTEPYLLFSDQSYDQVSVTLSAILGADSEGGRWLTSHMLEKVVFNLSVWSSEEALALSTVQLLKSIVKSSRRAAVAIQCDTLWSLMSSYSSWAEPLASLPPPVQRDLMGSLVQSAVGQRRDEFLSQLLQPLKTRFQSIIGSAHPHKADVRRSLLSVLESLCGVCQSVWSEGVTDTFSYLLPFLESAVTLVEVYKDDGEVVPLVLELFSLVAENLVVFLEPVHTVKLYEVSLSLIQMYAKCNTGKYKQGCVAEEETCEDLLLFMKMLSHLTTKDYLDFGGVSTGTVGVTPGDVVITGIQIIIPLMIDEILKFPTLCRQFYSLLQYISEGQSEGIARLPLEMLLTLMRLLEAGLSNYGQDVCASCLESIECLALLYGSSSSSLPALSQPLQHFLQVLFEMMLSSSFDLELVEQSAAAVFTLICCFKDHYTSLVEAIVTGHCSDPEAQTRLLEAFTQLTPHSLNFDFSKQSRTQFKKNLEHFLPHVKGFLYYR